MMGRRELETKLRMQEIEIQYLKQMLESITEQRQQLTDVLVFFFGAHQSVPMAKENKVRSAE